MSFAIGLRFYRVAVVKNSDKKSVEFDSTTGLDPYDFVTRFVDEKSSPVDEGENQRTWFFDRKPTNSIRSVHGLINYGTHGFESTLKNVITKKENYKRQATDLEEIPLYFQFWLPSNEHFGFAAFQSFQGRSCVGFVTKAITESFQRRYPGFRMLFSKLMPNEATMAALGDAPVKQITLIRSSKPNDPADELLRGFEHSEYNYEISLKAKRKGTLGFYRDLSSISKKIGDKSILMHEGSEFDEVKAEIEFRGKRKIIGLLGYNSDAGVMEVSQDVRRGKDGHPVFDDMVKEVDGIMEEFYGNMKT